MKENREVTDTNVEDIENSIEKDEKILNNIKTYMQKNIEKGYHKFVYNDLGYDEKCIDVINAIEHILSDYKRVLKENEELKKLHIQDNKHLDFIMEHSIPVQKVKDKIEEIQKEYSKLDKQVDEYINDVNKDLSKYYENKERIGEMQMLSYFIDNLQELMEESEKD